MKTVELVIVINNQGDPRHPKAWSGTTSNVFHAIENLGVSVVGINSGLEGISKKFYQLVHQLSGLGNNYIESPIFRIQSGKIAYRQIQQLGYPHLKVLHMGQLGLPLPSHLPGVDQYLLCDTTRYTWDKFPTPPLNQYTAKMLKLAEEQEWQAFAQIKHFFPFSEYVRDDLINHYQIPEHRITVVGSGRGKIAPFTGEKDYENGYILFVANSRFEHKGGRLLLAGFQIAQRENPSLKLIIVGQDEYLHLNGTIPNLTVKGYIPGGEELQNLFNHAALFAMPSLNDAWGLVYLEALACKTPILGLNRNALPEITQNGRYGFLVDEPKPEAIAHSILQAFAQPEKLREMGVAGQKYCLEKFTWEQFANKILSVMLSI